MATTSYGTPMVSSTMPNTTGMSTAPSTITITSPMVSPVMPVTPRLSGRAPLPMTQTQTSTMTSTPMVSTVMANPVVPTQTTSTPMTSTGTSGPLVNRNMGLPLSSARPIEVTETTSNLEEIQNFPVIGRAADGTHFHQDPVSGQVYRMTEEFHQRIPEILRNRFTLITDQVVSIETMPNRNSVFNTSTRGSEIDIDSGKLNIIDEPIKRTGTTLFTDSILNLDRTVLSDLSTNYVSSLSNEQFNILNQQIDSNFYDISLDYSQLNTTIQFETNKNLFVNNFINTNQNLLQSNGFIGKYIPVNRFISATNFYSMGVGISYFTPINTFYNR